jgi:hypothetical protein
MAKTVGKGGKLTVNVDEALDRLIARAASKAAVMAGPWVTGLMIGGMGLAGHAMWGDPGAAPWAAMAETAGTLGLAAAAVTYSAGRSRTVRTHIVGTVGASGTWVTVATIAGVSPRPVWSLLALGGSALALSWNVRQVVMSHGAEDGEDGGDRIAALLKGAAAKVGVEAKHMRTIETTDRKATVRATLDGGTVAEDLQKKTREIESAMQLPPGSVNVTVDEDRADRATVITSDPRVLRRPTPWPGPSRPGESIALPLRVGLWQDGEDVEHVIVGHHVQVMGKTGSGKSEGAAWNYLAEITSRADSCVVAIDITKGEQFLGPMRPALHRFETTKTGARALVADLHRTMRARMDHLAKKGLTKWEPGCGLSYLVVWIEEFPDVGDAIDMNEFMSIVKALRSGGGTLVMSLQRSDYSQMPTLARGQLAKLCFAVDSDADAEFGLSTRQDDNPAVRPDLWATCGPDTVGMAYLDAPSIPPERTSMALRTYWWRSDTAALGEHAQEFTAETRPADPVTMRHLLGGEAAGAAATPAAVPATAAAVRDEDQEEDDVTELGGDLDGDPVAQHLKSADPTPDLGVDDPDAPIDATGYEGWTFDKPQVPAQRMTTEDARALLLGQLAQWFAVGPERRHFREGDLRQVWAAAGRSRGWAGRFVRETLVPAGLVVEDDERGGYVIVRDPQDEDALIPA